MTIKFQKSTFTLGIVMALIALVASFISAPSYGYLFGIIIIFDLMALVCFGCLLRQSRRWTLAVLLPGLFVLYTITDVILRIMCGTRVLDILR